MVATSAPGSPATPDELALCAQAGQDCEKCESITGCIFVEATNAANVTVGQCSHFKAGLGKSQTITFKPVTCDGSVVDLDMFADELENNGTSMSTPSGANIGDVTSTVSVADKLSLASFIIALATLLFVK